jgi:hypothetical protein
MRVLICGGRDFADKRLVMTTMAQVEERGAITCVIEGGYRGADEIGKLWAEWKGLPVLEVKANWKHYGKRAGPVRNQWMLDLCRPDLVVAFPGGSGTEDMILRADNAGIDVLRAASLRQKTDTLSPPPANRDDRGL